MPIVNMKDMLEHAYQNGYAVGAFDVVSLDFITGVVRGAECANAPVILSVAQSHFDYFDFELLMASVEKAAQRATVPVAIHLDHGASIDTAIQSVRLGCNGVMVDASHRPLEDNIATTRAVRDMAAGCGIPVEGELGYVPGVEGEDARRHPGEITYTTIDDAQEYVQRTQVDFLAVSIGTVHGRMKGTPQLDIDRLKSINKALGIPLVLHGGTGLADDQYTKLIENGIAKINYYTALADIAGERIEHNIEAAARGYTSLVKTIPDAIAQEVERCCHLWGCAGRAPDVLTTASPWRPVEHLIIYNTTNENPADDRKMIEEGERVLSQIPGVRRIYTGTAVQETAGYKYTWLVQFCHQSVIDSYRDHPDHVAFADTHFRPIAGERISIDYQT